MIALIQVCVGVVMLAPFAKLSALPASASTWAPLVTLGVVHTGLMYILLYGAIQRLPTHLVGSLSFIYPIAAILVDRLAFGHQLQPVQFIGAGIILLSAAAMNRGWSFSNTVFWKRGAPQITERSIITHPPAVFLDCAASGLFLQPPLNRAFGWLGLAARRRRWLWQLLRSARQPLACILPIAVLGAVLVGKDDDFAVFGGALTGKCNKANAHSFG